MIEFSGFSLPSNLALFGIAALVIAVAATYLTVVAERLAVLTGLGEALIGGLLLGASTSLSGVITSVTAALHNQPDLAAANAVGGIAAQTAFLAIADITYRKANLEHAAASVTNLNQACLLIILLSFPLIAALLPETTVFGIHPVSFLIIAVYFLGLRLVDAARRQPLWEPVGTSATRLEKSANVGGQQRDLNRLLVQFLTLALVVGGAGWIVAGSGIAIAAQSGLSQTAVGALMTAVVTSSPELITTIAAVRRGALQLAVGGIVGGNTFDILFLVGADIAYRPGSLYHHADQQFLFWVALSILMTGILLMGLIRRERHGPANIGFESASLLILYMAAIGVSLALPG